MKKDKKPIIYGYLCPRGWESRIPYYCLPEHKEILQTFLVHDEITQAQWNSIEKLVPPESKKKTKEEEWTRKCVCKVFKQWRSCEHTKTDVDLSGLTYGEYISIKKEKADKLLKKKNEEENRSKKY